jgi:hypothetical protein
MDASAIAGWVAIAALAAVVTTVVCRTIRDWGMDLRQRDTLGDL